jgi:ribulose 1,5-bisphosphate synthetase/thiazole synthase
LANVSLESGQTMFEPIIVGAEPAGSSAARRAGKLGLDTLLLEKQRFPRYKACGGGVTERPQECVSCQRLILQEWATFASQGDLAAFRALHYNGAC